MIKELLIEKTPKYTEILPISGQRVTYRPFLVREEKNLLLANETSSFEDLMVTIKDVVNSCVSGLPNDDCSEIPFCDLEFIFLKIREKSLGETVDCVITCPVTGEKLQSQIDLSNVKIKNKNSNNKIKLDNDVTIVMQQPTMNTYLTLNKFKAKEEENIIKLLAYCIKEVKTKEESYLTKEVSQDEVIEFVENLTAKQFNSLLVFIKNIPTVEQKIDYITKDGEKRNITLVGFSDFLELFLVMRL